QAFGGESPRYPSCVPATTRRAPRAARMAMERTRFWVNRNTPGDLEELVVPSLVLKHTGRDLSNESRPSLFGRQVRPWRAYQAMPSHSCRAACTAPVSAGLGRKSVVVHSRCRVR